MAEAVENTEARGDHPPTRGAPGGPPLQVQSAIFVLAVPKWLAVSSMRSIRSQRFKPMFVCLCRQSKIVFLDAAGLQVRQDLHSSHYSH